MLYIGIISVSLWRYTGRTCDTKSTPHLADFPTLGSQLVDLGLCDVSTLLSFFQLMLNLPVPGQVGVGLLLLFHQTCVK